MATRTAKGSKTAAKPKSAAKPAAKEAPTRASEAELDRLAAKVVSLRDDKGLAWGDIQEQMDIAPSRLRALYNRGGGEPTGARSGSGAKAKPAAKGKTAAAKGKTGTRRGKKADPSVAD